VKEAVGNQSMSDDEILAVFQCYDYNVDDTVAALLEGLVSVVTLWQFALGNFYRLYLKIALF